MNEQTHSSKNELKNVEEKAIASESQKIVDITPELNEAINLVRRTLWDPALESDDIITIQVPFKLKKDLATFFHTLFALHQQNFRLWLEKQLKSVLGTVIDALKSVPFYNVEALERLEEKVNEIRQL